MKKILIVEDDKYLINAYRVRLKKDGFEIKMAMNGEEALQALQDYTPDLILLDLVMPGKDGFITLAELKANPKWKNIPVIVSSNLGQKEDIEKAKAAGAQDYLIKTEVNLEDIVAKIDKILC